MVRTLYGMVRETKEAASRLRAEGLTLAPAVDRKLERFEAAVRHALASSPDGETIALAEELVALDALCDLHVALQDQPEALRARLQPIVDNWIAYAAMSGLTPEELERRADANVDPEPLETWLDDQEP